MRNKTQETKGAQSTSCWLKTVSLVGAFGLGVTHLSAQEAVSASGGNASGTGGSFSYTIGQLAYSSIESTAGTLSQGVQQPYLITTETALPNTDSIDLHCQIYPNPTSDILNLTVGGADFLALQYSLFDANGKELEHGTVHEKQTVIAVQALTDGNYYLNVSNSVSVIKSFKIIKQK